MPHLDAVEELETLEVRGRQLRTQPVLFDASSSRKHSRAARYSRRGKKSQANSSASRRCGKRYGL